jgi:hypothetical protein
LNKGKNENEDRGDQLGRTNIGKNENEDGKGKGREVCG